MLAQSLSARETHSCVEYRSQLKLGGDAICSGLCAAGCAACVRKWHRALQRVDCRCVVVVLGRRAAIWEHLRGTEFRGFAQ